MGLDVIESATYSIHNSKIHSYLEGGGAKMNTFGKVSEQLMVEGLDPKSISTLMVDTDELAQLSL